MLKLLTEIHQQEWRWNQWSTLYKVLWRKLPKQLYLILLRALWPLKLKVSFAHCTTMNWCQLTEIIKNQLLLPWSENIGACTARMSLYRDLYLSHFLWLGYRMRAKRLSPVAQVKMDMIHLFCLHISKVFFALKHLNMQFILPVCFQPFMSQTFVNKYRYNAVAGQPHNLQNGNEQLYLEIWNIVHVVLVMMKWGDYSQQHQNNYRRFKLLTIPLNDL